MNLHSHKEGSTPPQYKKNLINMLKNKNHNIASNSEAAEWKGREFFFFFFFMNGNTEQAKCALSRVCIP